MARTTKPVLGHEGDGADAGQAAPATPFEVTRLLVLTDEDLRILAAWGAVPPGEDATWALARMVDRPEAAVALRVAALRALGAIPAAGPLPEAVRAVLAARAKALLEGLREGGTKKG
jgi:hypothetical protein